MSIDGVWIKPTAEQAKRFNEGVDTAKEIISQLEADLAAATQQVEDVEAQLTAVAAERDALHRENTRLREALEVAARRFRHPTCEWEDAAEDIDAALRGEPTTTKETTP